MKKLKTIFAAMLLCTGLVSFVSCIDKEEDDPATPAAKSVEGVYHGDVTCSVMGSESVFEDATFTVTATDDATVSIAVSPFGEPPMRLESITIPGIAVSGADGVHTLATTEFSGTTESGKTYSGTLQGDFANNIISLKFSLQYGAMPMLMIFTFSAPKAQP